MPDEFSFGAPHVGCTEMIGRVFASCVFSPLILWLIGDLGSGKTTFSRSFIHSLGYRGGVVSPTYTLLEIYEVSDFNILHFDFYRINSVQDFETLGAREQMDGQSICLIEWPENIVSKALVPDVILRFAFVDDGRQIEVKSGSDAGVTIIKDVGKKLQTDNALFQWR